MSVLIKKIKFCRIASFIIALILAGQLLAYLTVDTASHIRTGNRIIYSDDPEYLETTDKLRKRVQILVPLELIALFIFLYHGWIPRKL